MEKKPEPQEQTFEEKQRLQTELLKLAKEKILKGKAESSSDSEDLPKS